MELATAAVDITDAQFSAISSLVHAQCGINLHDGKRELVRARLAKRLRKLGIRSFEAYLDYLRHDRGDEMVAMLDALSTNLTSFFREIDHFTYLTESIVPKLPSKRLRVWSAGCSSGEEPYTTAMCLAEALPDFKQWDLRILATDLSTAVLARAREGVYSAEKLSGMPGGYLPKYFVAPDSGQVGARQVRSDLRQLIHFARLNLMEHWPMHGPFDVIFCRNVMIYFDKPTQGRLIERFWQMLAPGGTLFIGHSESLTGIRHQFRYVQPTVYEKPAGEP